MNDLAELLRMAMLLLGTAKVELVGMGDYRPRHTYDLPLLKISMMKK